MKLEVNAMSIRISGKIQKLLSFLLKIWNQIGGGPKSGYHHQLDDFSNTSVCVSAGKKSFCPPPPLWVQDGQGVSDIGRNTYANLMTPTGNKNCQSLWLFRVEPALVSSNTCAACCWLLVALSCDKVHCFKLFLANFLVT